MGAGEGSGSPSRVTSAFGSLSQIVRGGSCGSRGGHGTGGCWSGVRDPKHPFAQSKQEDVKLVVAQPALIDIKASVFKNRSKIPLPSPAFAIPTIVPVAGLPPRRSSEPGASGQRGGAVQSRWPSGCTVFLCKMELPCRGDYLLWAVLMGAVPWRATLAAVVWLNRGVICPARAGCSPRLAG